MSKRQPQLTPLTATVILAVGVTVLTVVTVGGCDLRGSNGNMTPEQRAYNRHIHDVIREHPNWTSEQKQQEAYRRATRELSKSAPSPSSTPEVKPAQRPYQCVTVDRWEHLDPDERQGVPRWLATGNGITATGETEEEARAKHAKLYAEGHDTR